MATAPASAEAGTSAAAFDTFRAIDLGKRKSVVIAVSGGGDSLALLVLFARYLRETGKAVKPLAVTVDHRLRPSSAEEARLVGEIAAGFGVDHRIMNWDGPKPATGVAAAAREARHRLLAQAAAEAGTDIVLTGHTRDDQAETVLMRRARGAGRGEAGIAPATLFCGECWFVRPLLRIRRKSLREFLASAGQAWVDDPTNVDPSYERARTRAALSGVEMEQLSAEAEQAAGLRTDVGLRAAALIRSHAGMPMPGLLRLDRNFVSTRDREAAIYALRILLACAGGRPQLPDQSRVAALFDRLGAVNLRTTLSRSVIDARGTGIFILRERRNLPAPSAIQSGLWDGRFRIEGSASDGVVIPAGTQGWTDAHDAEAAQAGVPLSLARAAFATLPALRANGAMQLLDRTPVRLDVVAAPVVAPWARYLPSFDAEPARAAADLLGAAPIPVPPLAREGGGHA